MADERGLNDDDVSPLGAAPTLPAEKTERKAKRVREGRRLPRPRPGSTMTIIIGAVVLLALVPVIGSSVAKTPTERVGISYGGGPFEGARFQRIVQPGHALFFNGFFDNLFLYPADQRNYIISKQTNEGDVKASDSVIAPSKDRVQIEFQVATYFKLNTDLLRPFHEQLGLKYSAFNSSGWDRLIQDTFRQQIENALQQEARRYNVADIYSDSELLGTIQEQVQATISDRLVAAVGQPFFCGPTFVPGGRCSDITFVIKKLDIPTSVVTAFEESRTSEVRAQSIETISAALDKAGPNYPLLRAIEAGKTTFWVIPTDSGLTLTAPGGTTPGTPGTPLTTSTTTTTTPGG